MMYADRALLAREAARASLLGLLRPLSRISFERCMHVAFSTTLSGTQYVLARSAQCA